MRDHQLLLEARVLHQERLRRAEGDRLVAALRERRRRERQLEARQVILAWRDLFRPAPAACCT